MALSEQDREWVRAIAAEVSAEIIRTVISEHIDACPYGKKLFAGKSLLIGICIGAIIFSGGGGAGFALAKLLMGM